jgi:hypothetical protein
VVGLALLVGGIAVADSINPSTIVPALYLAARHRAAAVGSFAAGVFTVYLAGGLALVLGPGPELIAALRRVGPELEHWIEAGAGALLLGVAVALWVRRRSAREDARWTATPSPHAALALGAGIAAIELPTAFIYFGAISAILASDSGFASRVMLIVAYNLLFVLPLLAIVAARALGPDVRFGTLRGWLWRAGPVALSAVVAVGGTALLAVGLEGMLSA